MVGACRTESGAKPESQVTPPIEKGSPADAAAPADAAPLVSDARLKEHMQKHFATIREIQRAVISGDLKTARERARWLRSHREPAILDDWRSHVEAAYRAAERLEKAPDLAAAAVLSAELAGQCGACHESTRAITTFEWTLPPAAGPELKTIMQRHQWAAERLWEGVVGPSDDRWYEGADMLAELGLDAEGLFGHLPEAHAIRASATQVRMTADEARKTRSAKERVRVYGELLQGCVGCHTRTRKVDAPK
jgi:cytochrome c553